MRATALCPRGEYYSSASTAQIPLLYPPSRDFGHDSMSPLFHIRSLLSKRSPHHKKWFYIWLAIAPLTTPFALLRESRTSFQVGVTIFSSPVCFWSRSVAVIPNLPFFYAVWRTWSHYRGSFYVTNNYTFLNPKTNLDSMESFAVLGRSHKLKSHNPPIKS